MAKAPRSTTSAHSLLEAGQSFVTAARALIRPGPDPLFREQLPAFYLLVGFALEVLMKSHLRLLGRPDFPDLKDIGHDLEAAMFALAERPGYGSDLPARLAEVVTQMQPHHLQLTMRYMPASGNWTLPHPNVVLAVLDELATAMRYRLLGVDDDGVAR